MTELNSSNFDNFINSPVPVAVDFYADWCGPCRALKPTLQKLSDRGFQIGKVDVDENRDLTVSYGISGIPAILIFKNGQLIHKHTGVLAESKLVELLS